MAQVAPLTISFKTVANPAGGYGVQQLVCGTCGCVVADEQLQTHVAWHATGAWVPATVVPNVPAGAR